VNWLAFKNIAAHGSPFSILSTHSLQDEMRWFGYGSRKFSMCRRDRRFVVSLMGKPEGKNLPRRPTRKGEYNIKVDLQEVCWRHGMD